MTALCNSSELARKFDGGEVVSICFQYISKETENDINSLLTKILSRHDKSYLYDTFEPVLRELVQNAIKANMKRVCFSGMNLNIADDGDYAAGMREFKKIAYHPELLKNKLFESQYQVAVIFRKLTTKIIIDVINNAPIMPIELERLRHRLKMAGECRNFTEAYVNLHDVSEGAGLGIIMCAMLLRNAGLEVNSITIEPDDDSMKISLTIPAELKSFEITSSIKDRILEEVQSLPTFPKNILELQTLCNNPLTKIETISEKLSLDPSLTADVLRLSNTAGFMTRKRIAKVNEAIMMIGLNNLKYILTAASSRQIINKRYRRFEQVWEHCNRTAYYARMIAIEKGQSKIADSALTAGLLHDIGKIVLLATDINLVNQISAIVDNRKIRSTAILEEIYIGISHSTIGALIAERWNFPEELSEAIRYHHAPLNPDITHGDLVMIVYMANLFATAESGKMNFNFFESEVLERFHLSSRAVFNDYYAWLSNRYDSHSSFLLRNAP
jgi:putative nucleotidyltransferase with HDIG domain